MAFLSLHVDSIIVKRRFFSNFSNKHRTSPHGRMFFLSLLFFISVTLLVLSGDIETDPGPDLGYSSSFSFFHWNLNRIAAHKFIKIALINAISIAGLQASLYKVLILFLNQKPI